MNKLSVIYLSSIKRIKDGKFEIEIYKQTYLKIEIYLKINEAAFSKASTNLFLSRFKSLKEPLKLFLKAENPFPNFSYFPQNGLFLYLS